MRYLSSAEDDELKPSVVSTQKEDYIYVKLQEGYPKLRAVQVLYLLDTAHT